MDHLFITFSDHSSLVGYCGGVLKRLYKSARTQGDYTPQIVLILSVIARHQTEGIGWFVQWLCFPNLHAGKQSMHCLCGKNKAPGVERHLTTSRAHEWRFTAGGISRPMWSPGCVDHQWWWPMGSALLTQVNQTIRHNIDVLCTWSWSWSFLKEAWVAMVPDIL